jgi:hypothetical protein
MENSKFVKAGYLQVMKTDKPNRRSIIRLRDALLKDSLFESLCILIGQQKQFIIFRDYKEYPLKLTTQMLDQVNWSQQSNEKI